MKEDPFMSLDELVKATKAIIAAKAITYMDEAVELASGQMSHHFVDGKEGFADPSDLRVACRAMAALVAAAGVTYNAVGGPTLGADHLCIGISLETGTPWYIVRKEPKGRGTARQIEGTQLGGDHRVMVVEDAISTGGSLIKAIDVIEATGATVVAVSTLIDRGVSTAPAMEDRAISYHPVSTYADFAMEPILVS